MTPATGPSSSPTPSATPAVGVSSLAWVMTAAVICGGVLAAGVLAQVTWAKGTPDIAGPAVQAILAVLVAMGVGYSLFALTVGRTPASAPMGLLAGSTVRMLVALSIALVMFFMGGFDKPTGTAFWIVFLSAALAAIVAEASWGVKNLHRIASASQIPAPQATTGAAPAETH
ncbi:MAG: hypothetical protein QM783_13185 [Phycisphaerales bacterium]